MHQGFGARSTADSVLGPMSLRSRHVLVTGVSSGLGRETARALVTRGARVIGTAPDPEALGEAGDALRDAAWECGGRFSVERLDLDALDSVRDCAARLVARGEVFDLVIAEEGSSPAAAGLGRFVLANRIAPLLREGARLISLAAPPPGGGDAPDRAAALLFAVAFDRRHRGRGVRAAAVHPGSIRPEGSAPVGQGRPWPGLKTVREAAATPVWAGLVAPAEAVGGRFCADCRVGPGPGPAGGGGAEALWARSESLAGERFRAP